MSKTKLVAKYILLGLGVTAPMGGSLWFMFEIVNLSVIENGVYPPGIMLLGIILYILFFTAGAILIGLLFVTFWIWILDFPGKSEEQTDE